jgi:hypothetical protein
LKFLGDDYWLASPTSSAHAAILVNQ